MSRRPALLRRRIALLFLLTTSLGCTANLARAEGEQRGPKKLAIVAVLADPDSAVAGESSVVLKTTLAVRASDGIGPSRDVHFQIPWTLEVRSSLGVVVTRRE